MTQKLLPTTRDPTAKLLAQFNLTLEPRAKDVYNLQNLNQK